MCRQSRSNYHWCHLTFTRSDKWAFCDIYKMQEPVTARDSSRPKSMSSFKKELASVLKNGPTAKVHMQAKLDHRSPNETDAELYQDTSTLQIVDLPWTDGPVLTELIHTPSTTQFTVPSVDDDVSQTGKEFLQHTPESLNFSVAGPEEEDQLKLPPENPPGHGKLQTEKQSKHKEKSPENSLVESEQGSYVTHDATHQQASGHQVHIKRKKYSSSERMSWSDDDGDNTKSEVQYTKLQTPVEPKKGFLSKFSFGKSKANIVPECLAEEGQQESTAEPPSKIILEEPGETSDFNSEQIETSSAASQKRGILGIGGQLRKSLFKRRNGRSDEKQKEGPLQQIRPDDDVDSDDEEVLVFAPALQIIDSRESGPSPTITDIPTEEPKAKLLTTERTSKKWAKKLPVQQGEIDSGGSKWYFKSAEELSRVTSGSLMHVSKTSLHSVPDQAYLDEEKQMGIDNSKANSKEDTRKAKKKAQGLFESKREGKPQDASIEAQKALEVLRKVEGLDKHDIHSPEDDDGGLRQYFEEVLPSSAEEAKKGNALAGAFHWFLRGGRKRPDPKPEVLVELVTAPRTSDVAVQFPEPGDEQTQEGSDLQQALEMPATESRSASRATAVSQELLWKIPGEQPSSEKATVPADPGKRTSQQPQTELVFRCPSVHEDFPVVQATHQPAADYVPGDSLLTLASLDINDQKLEATSATPVQYSSNLKPPKIPIFAGCCPAPNKTVDLSVPYGPTKESSSSKGKARAKDDDPKSSKDVKNSAKRATNPRGEAALGNSGDDLAKQQKDMKKHKLKDSSASPAVAIVKTVAKQVVVKLREREQRKRRHRELLHTPVRGVVDLLKTRKWRSCPTLATQISSSNDRKASPDDCTQIVSSRQKISEQYAGSQNSRRASC